MPVNEALAHALNDLTLDPVDTLDGDPGLQHSLTVGHGTTEAGASFIPICFTCTTCSCCC